MILSEQNMRDYDKQLKENRINESKSSDLILKIVEGTLDRRQGDMKLLDKLTGKK